MQNVLSSLMSDRSLFSAILSAKFQLKQFGSNISQKILSKHTGHSVDGGRSTGVLFLFDWLLPILNHKVRSNGQSRLRLLSAFRRPELLSYDP